MPAHQNQDASSKKRARDGEEQKEPRSSLSGGHNQEQRPKRRKVVAAGFGLGAFAGMVGKALKATASVFARGGQQRRSPLSRRSRTQRGAAGAQGDASAAAFEPTMTEVTPATPPRLETPGRKADQSSPAGGGNVVAPSERADRSSEADVGHELGHHGGEGGRTAGRAAAAVETGVGRSAGVWSRSEDARASAVAQGYSPYGTRASEGSGGYRTSGSNGSGEGSEAEEGEAPVIILGEERQAQQQQDHKHQRRWRHHRVYHDADPRRAKMLGMGLGMPRLDADALRHALSFLKSHDLARFARASSAARELVSGHAALVIAERYAGLRVGVRELRVQAPPRRLAFGAATGGDRGSGRDAEGSVRGRSGGGGGGGAPSPAHPSPPANHANPASPPPSVNNANTINISNASTNSNHNPHGRLWDPESDARLPNGEGSSSGGRVEASQRAAGEVAAREHSRPMRRERYRGVSGSDAELARFSDRNGNKHLALPALFHLECSGDLLARQLKTLPRLDLFRTLQSRAVLGPNQFLTAHMRAVLVDWCVEVAFQFRLSTISLHAAVSALDVCLSKVAVPRCRLQLLGVVCAMIQSQAGGGCQLMSTAEAIHICDSQYNPSQVHSTFNIVVSNTQQATTRTVPATAAEILHRHLLAMGARSGLVRPLSVGWEKHSEVAEEYVLAGLLIDLSLLDQYMFRFRPGTLAAAALFLARVTAMYYSKEGVWVTPVAVVEKTNREVLRLYKKGVCRPFVEHNDDLERHPFGAPGLEDFVASQPMEAEAVRKCVERLWLVQQDFFMHIFGLPSPQPVLFRYQHMFKGIKDKFVPVRSQRLQAYQRLGLLEKSELERMLDKHLPTTAIPPICHHPGGSAADAVVLSFS